MTLKERKRRIQKQWDDFENSGGASASGASSLTAGAEAARVAYEKEKIGSTEKKNAKMLAVGPTVEQADHLPDEPSLASDSHAEDDDPCEQSFGDSDAALAKKANRLGEDAQDLLLEIEKKEVKLTDAAMLRKVQNKRRGSILTPASPDSQ